MHEERFAFAFDRGARRLLGLIGVTEASAEVVVTDQELIARFGRFIARTPLANITEVRITGPYRWAKAIGPRGSFADRGATFGTNARSGVCMRFAEPITALAGRRMLHPGLTVTVADPDALAATLRRRPGG